jgi:GNAT superfamily N-acetyltransferase
VIIEQVDAFDDVAFAEWFRPFRASELSVWPQEPGWTEHELRVLYRDTSENDMVIAVARNDGGLSIGCLDVSLPKRESLQNAYILLAVDPAYQRQGVGRALLEHGEEIARQSGRERVLGRTDEPVQDGKPRSWRFAEAAGYRAGRVDARRELRLPPAPGVLDALEAEALPFATDYDIVTWTGSCPDALTAGRIELGRILSADAPHGSLDYEEEVWDLERLGNWERNVNEMGRDLLAAGAIERSSGAMVGFTEIGLPRDQQSVAYQFDTVVAPGQRGHRLGMLLKIANMRALVEHSPQTQRTLTWNATENDPMIRVNEAMGFQLVGLTVGWQKDLT